LDGKKDSKLKERLGIAANHNFFYVLIICLFVAYVFTGMMLLGLLIGLCIVWVVALEFLIGASEHGIKNELKETAIALLIALIIWFGAGFILNTPSPINAIVSCSMLPHIQRGDMVLLSGDRISAPLEKVESLGGIGTARVFQDGNGVLDVNGSLYAYCAQHQGEPICNSFILAPEKFFEKHGPLTIGYERCEILYPKTGVRQTGPCVAYLEVNGKRYYENLSNDVVVYQPNRSEYYSRVGDIIHRVFIKLSSKNQTYFLTKGENNPILDIQVYDEASRKGNRPVEVERSKGRILFNAPYIGYLKLFISPSAIPTPEGCDRYYAKYEKT